jgi:hypothetical protein
MNTEKIKTLEQIHDAIDSVEEARALDGLTPAQKLKLETASVKLRNLERTIIRAKTNELIALLTADANGLKDLSNEIKQSADKLAGVSAAIEKAVKIVEGFINIVASAVAAGLL